MRIKAASFLFIYLMVSLSSFAERRTEGRHAKARVTVATPEEDYYDVEYVKMEIEATNLSTAITGHVTTRAKVAAASMGEYYFELSNQLIIDSAKINGGILPVTQVNTWVNKISLPFFLAQNAVFTAEVFYHGAPTGGTGFFTNGILHQTDASLPVQVTHTVSAAVHSRDWWPCKQSLTDKIDSADIWVTVPAGLKVAGNGLLKNVTPVSGTTNRYEWSSRYPADYYLLSFSVAPYNEYNYFVQFPAGNDSMLVQNFIYNDPSILQQHQDELDTIGLIINHFSSLFGKYPFANEKFGICQTPLGGGMENQTMVSLGSLHTTLIAHELAHQWWGDNVTCGSLKDMWLNEGFATYCEQLYVEQFWGQAAAQSYRTGVFNQVMYGASGTVEVSDTTNELRIYDGRLTYQKGAAVAHMLRYLINDDSSYFQVLKYYQQQYAYKTAVTTDLKTLAEQTTNVDLDTFFNQWVYKEGFPTYTAKWYQNGNQVLLKLVQTTSMPSSVSVFKLPIQIKLTSAQGDTIIKIDNYQATQFYIIDWSKTMTGLVLDPNNHIVNKTLPTQHDAGLLDIEAVTLRDIEIYPNPSSNGWVIKNVPANSELVMIDMQGREIYKSIALTDPVSIPSAHLAAGSYLLTIRNKEQLRTTQLVRP
jgi:aminopeptidase N